MLSLLQSDQSLISNTSSTNDVIGGFESEAVLVDVLERKVATTRDHSDCITIRELDSSNGIADLVVTKLSHGWRNSMPVADVNPRWLFLLSQLPYRLVISLDDFTALSGFSRRYALAALTQFSALGFCIQNKNTGTWKKIKQPVPFAQEIWAIEAKLRDWRRALYQACRYREYATQSWVILDEYHVSSAVKNINEFVRRNIGLGGISQTGKLTVLHHALSSRPKFPARYWYVNGQIAQRLSQDFKYLL